MYPVSQDSLKKIQQLDLWVIEKLRVAFGNRILKQMVLYMLSAVERTLTASIMCLPQRYSENLSRLTWQC